MNKRSTPSGDGRGRGRAAGQRGSDPRGNSSAGSRGGSQGSFQGGPRGGSRSGSRGGFQGRPQGQTQGDDRRGGVRGSDRRGDNDFGGERRSEDRREGRYEGRREGPNEGRGGSAYGRDGAGYRPRANDRRGDRPGFSDDRGSFRSGRGDSRGAYGRRDDDREGGFGRSDDRRSSRAEPGGSRSRYGRPDGDRERGFRADEDRPRFRDDRDARPPYRSDDRSDRGDRGDRREPAYRNSGDRNERSGPGDRRERWNQIGERGSDGRSSLRGRRDGGRSTGDRRDDVRTIGRIGGERGGERGGSRARYGKDTAVRRELRGTGGSGGPGGSGGTGARVDGRGGARGDSWRTGRDSGRYADRGANPVGNRNPGGNPFKSSRQPLRDPDFYDRDYTDERDTTEVPGGERLQKVLAQAGVASRRACEEMIGDGRVTVDGQVVRRFGARVDPAKQVIHVDGKRLPTAPDLVYYALNKPIGVVSTMDDPDGRPSLQDYVQDLAPRLFHVGRLDTETEGLLLLTNDGELAHRLTHPSYGVTKKYWAKVPGPVPRDLHRILRKGVQLEDGLAKADEFRIVQEHGQQALVEIVLHEGRKHIVRRMLEEAGHRVIDLARIEFGPVKLGRLKPGTVRTLTLQEVGELYAAVGL